jgi:hypothetical protein
VRADPGQKQDPVQRSGIPRHRVSVSGTIGAGAPPRLDQGHPSSATRRYLVETNGSFRAYRMRKECGPIRDPELRASCLGSFSVYEPR